MAPRGLSADEKRVKLLELFHESKDFYQLKELEKLGPKLKGIVSQSVKEVLQSLVDDGLVLADKIGSSNFFWSFPSQRGTIVQTRLTNIKETHDNYRVQLGDLKSSIESEKLARLQTEDRTLSLEKLVAGKNKLLFLERELNEYGACDPSKLQELNRGITLAREATIRWTDNYAALLSYFTRQTGVGSEEVRKYLDIGDDYEDIC